MKKIGIVLCLVLAVAIGAVIANDTAAMNSKAEHHKMMGKSHKLTVEVVSVDPAAKTMTIKDENGADKTVPVMGDAVAHLKHLKAGDKVEVMCKDNEKGEHMGISHIMMPKGAKM